MTMRNTIAKAVLEINPNELARGLDEVYVQDTITTVQEMNRLGTIYTNDELTVLLLAYIIKKQKQGKKAYLSKFIRKMLK